MCETLGHIFARLHISERDVRSIKKTLKNQAKVNRNLAAFTVIMATQLIFVQFYIMEHEKKLKSLKDELKELKRAEGD